MLEDRSGGLDMNSYKPLTSSLCRPLLLVDVDGVLSLFGFDGASPPAGRGALIEGVPHLLSQHAANLLIRLADAFDCVWCTGWEERADEHLPHLLGLPRGWPHLTFPRAPGPGVSTAGHWKLASIDAFAGPHRPLAWIDDAFDASCFEWAAGRPGPTLLVATYPAVGLTESQATALAGWAAKLAQGRRGPRRP